MTSFMRNKRKSVIVGTMLGVILLFIVSAAGILYLNSSAEKNAKSFCDGIELGSDIAPAVARANERKIFYGHDKFYTFYFPGFAFEKAVCEISVDQRGKVLSKDAEMQYD